MKASHPWLVPLAIGATAALLVFWWWPAALAQAAALRGVVAATLTGYAALFLKQRATASKQLSATMLAMGTAFGLRLLVVGFGAWNERGHPQGPFALTVSFFLVYLAQQWNEVRRQLDVKETHV